MLKQCLLFLIVVSTILGQAQNTSFSNEKPIHLRGIYIWRKARKIELEGWISIQKGLIELLATAPGGKEYESLLVLKCSPDLFRAALLLIQLSPGGGGKYQGDQSPIYGDRVYIYVQWQENNREKIVRAEDLIWDQKHAQTMKRTFWVFTGSRFKRNPYNNKIESFMANITKTLVATYYDPDAILNNPLPERTDDTVYYVYSEKVPAPKTFVRVIFSATPLEFNTK